MTHELLSEYRPLKELPEQWIITRVETKGGEKKLVATEIRKDGKGPDSEYSKFVVREIGWLDGRIKQMRAGVPAFKGHGVRRPESEARQVQEHRNQEVIPYYTYVISALSGMQGVQIEFFKRKRVESQTGGASFQSSGAGNCYRHQHF